MLRMEKGGPPCAGVLITGETRAGKIGAVESVTDYSKVKLDPCKRIREWEESGEQEPKKHRDFENC